MKALFAFIFLLLSSQSFAYGVGSLSPFAITNYQCQLSASNGEKSLLTMTVKEYLKPGDIQRSNWAIIDMGFTSPIDLHGIERDPVGIFPSKIPLIVKDSTISLLSSYIASGNTREVALRQLFTTIIPLHLYFQKSRLSESWESPYVQFQEISANQAALSMYTLERHSARYEKSLDLNGLCEVVN